MNRPSMEDLGGSKPTLYVTTIVDTYHYTIVQTHRAYQMKSEPNVNYELWVIMICQCRFVSCNKYMTLGGDGDNGGDYAYVR